MERRKSLIKSESIAICKIVAGCFLYALSVVLFIDPAKIIPGSVTGIGVVVKALTGFPIGILSIIINVPLVIWGTIVLGKRLLIYTGLTVLLSSSMIDMLAFLKPFTQDVFLASVFGGVVMGVGLGMILDAGGTTGGDDRSRTAGAEEVSPYPNGKYPFSGRLYYYYGGITAVERLGSAVVFHRRFICLCCSNQ